jgi:hypothetical protein
MFDGRFWGAETPSKKKLDEAAALRCASEMRSAIDLRSQYQHEPEIPDMHFLGQLDKRDRNL